MTIPTELAVKPDNRERADALALKLLPDGKYYTILGRREMVANAIAEAYDQSDRRIAALEAMIVEGRNSALLEARHVVVQYIIAMKVHDNEASAARYMARHMADAATEVCRRIEQLRTQPDRSKARDRVVRAAICLDNAWSDTEFLEGHEWRDEIEALRDAVQALTEPPPAD